MKPSCHPERKHVSRGLCGSCYNRWLRLSSPEKLAKYKRYYSTYSQKNAERRKLDAKKRRDANPQRAREIWLKSRYGLTSAQLDEMISRQKSLCSICKRQKKLVIDHDHNVGIIRGLLCGRCNTGLGKFEDDPSLLEKAVRYLREARHVQA